MKSKINRGAFLILLAGINLLFLTGCQTNQIPLALDPIGPAPSKVLSERADGSLVVYSAFDPHGHSGFERQVHTDYKIYSTEGVLLQNVHNDTDGMVGGPVTVRLPAGTYRIEARANGYGMVSVPVVIRGDQTTTVHLSGGGSWPNRQEMIRVGAVQLPDGRVVGWRADAQNSSAP